MLVIALTTLGMLISNQQKSSALSFAAWILFGVIVGFIGSKLLNANQRRVRYMLLSIVGAIVGGFLSNLLGPTGALGLDLYSVLVAMVGAVMFMIVYHAMFRRRRFLSMK